MSSELNQTPLQQDENHAPVSGIRNNNVRKTTNRSRQQKSITGILKSSCFILFHPTNMLFTIVLLCYLLLLILCTLIFELVVQETLFSLTKQPSSQFSFCSSYTAFFELLFRDSKEGREYFHVVHLYLGPCPGLEFLCMVITFNFAGKIIHNRKSKQTDTSTFKELLWKSMNIPIFKPFATFMFVKFFSAITFLVFLALANAWFAATCLCGRVLALGLSTALVYKYIYWSLSWNMAIVISTFEDGVGISALKKANYYCERKVGFQLMLVFLGVGVSLRVINVYAAIWFGDSFEVLVITPTVLVLYFYVILVKWVALVCYFHDRQKQIAKSRRLARTVGDMEAADALEG